MKIILTNHAELRLKKRKILGDEVLDAVKNPDKTIKKHGQFLFQKQLDRGLIEIACEKTENNLKVITVYWL
ncbi:hypothetical protein CMO93_00180 [Candidatus Woesearchaeota archaeon]|nr:hypothetical protein [Candidatus Woesearchaeota archaeon]|tara:strand:- start:3025 stop:3237 length:213 start_codon:yes stop_codon:yes gene_type:complete